MGKSIDVVTSPSNHSPISRNSPVRPRRPRDRHPPAAGQGGRVQGPRAGDHRRGAAAAKIGRASCRERV